MDPNFAPKQMGNFKVDRPSSVFYDRITILLESKDKGLATASSMTTTVGVGGLNLTTSMGGGSSGSLNGGGEIGTIISGGLSIPNDTSSPSPLTSSSSSSSSKLSTQAKLGILISMPLLFISMSLGIFLFFRRRNIGRKGRIELDWNGIREHYEIGTGEIGIGPGLRNEMDGKGNMGELDSDVRRFEVEGS